jgi:hypothetical protein
MRFNASDSRQFSCLLLDDNVKGSKSLLQLLVLFIEVGKINIYYNREMGDSRDYKAESG